MKRAVLRPAMLGAAIVLAVLLLWSPGPSGSAERSSVIAPGPLPQPPRSGGMSLVEALWKRRSVRAFSEKPVPREALAFVLWAADGVNRPEEKKRTAPSAWGSNAVSVYVTSPEGTVVYDAEAHALKPLEGKASKDLRGDVASAEFTRKAPLVLVLAVDYKRYGGKAAPAALRDMAYADAGIISQNVYLAATSLGLGTVVTADVRAEARDALGLGPDGQALFTMPLGYPGEAPAKR